MLAFMYESKFSVCLFMLIIVILLTVDVLILVQSIYIHIYSNNDKCCTYYSGFYACHHKSLLTVYMKIRVGPFNPNCLVKMLMLRLVKHYNNC